MSGLWARLSGRERVEESDNERRQTVRETKVEDVQQLEMLEEIRARNAALLEQAGFLGRAKAEREREREARRKRQRLVDDIGMDVMGGR